MGPPHRLQSVTRRGCKGCVTVFFPISGIEVEVAVGAEAKRGRESRSRVKPTYARYELLIFASDINEDERENNDAGERTYRRFGAKSR